jgi:radical SAM superfamily enzyme YgiQ (UPF0313 family)
MKIALIYPNVSVLERYGTDIGEIGGRQSPLGIMYLSAFMKKCGHDVILIDASSENLEDEDVIRKIKLFSPSLAGISATSAALRNSQRLAAKMKETMDVKTVLGGPHISSNSDDFGKSQSFDFAISGEGEIPLKKLVEKLDSGKCFDKVPGLLWRDADGNAVQNPRGETMELDSVPFPDRESLKDIRKYRPPIGSYMREPVLSMITSRGCPYECIFCDNGVFGRKVRFFSHEYVLREIECLISKFGAREIMFVDDTFPLGKKRFENILAGMIENKFKIKWSCMANANDLDEKILPLMKEAGCWQIAIGIESGDDNILRTIKKKASSFEIAKIANSAHKLGIFVKGFFMVGHPGETTKTLEKTRRFALSLPLSDVTCTIATPVKGSQFYKMALSGEYGYFDSKAEAAKFSYWEPVFVPAGLSADGLFSAQRKFLISFYARPVIIFRQLKKIKSLKVLFRFLRSALKIVFARKTE